MKRIALAAALLACATAPLAQAPEIPKHKCQPKPEYPGRLAMQSDTRRRSFDRDLKAYRDCMTAYVDERKEQANLNTAAGNAAIEEYNALMKKLNEEQAAANELSK